MNVLLALLRNLRKFYEDKRNIGYVDVNKLKEIDVVGLTSEEIVLLVNGNKSYSDEFDFVVARLNNILRILEERDTSKNGILRDFLSDISNWDSEIYVEEKRQFFWRYESFINEKENNRRYCIELRCCGKKIMAVEAITTLNGRLLKFFAKYHTDISKYGIIDDESKKIVKYGTIVINVECPIDDKIIFEDVIYNLDLLGGKEFSDEELKENTDEKLKKYMISEYHNSINYGKVRK